MKVLGKLQINFLNGFQKQCTKHLTCFYWTVKVKVKAFVYSLQIFALHCAPYISRSNEFQENAVIAKRQVCKALI